MNPWIAQRSERQRERQREGLRLPLFIEPPAPRGGEERVREHAPEDERGWCVIEDDVSTVIDTAIDTAI